MYWFLAVLGLRCCTGFPLVVVSGGLLSCCGAGASQSTLPLLRSIGARACGLQELRLPGPRAQAQWLWHMGLIALQHVGSSRIRDQTHVSCIGRQILYHWATREVPGLVFIADQLHWSFTKPSTVTVITVFMCSLWLFKVIFVKNSENKINHPQWRKLFVLLFLLFFNLNS